MKKLSFCILATLFMFAVTPSQLSAETSSNPVPVESTVPPESEVAAKLTARLMQIKEMDFSAMDRAEKRALRSEVRAIKGELKAVGGGVYLSVGAIIIIILLLILLL